MRSTGAGSFSIRCSFSAPLGFNLHCWHIYSNGEFGGKKNSLHSQKIVVLALNIVCPGLKSVFLEGRMNEVMENFSVWRGCRWTGVARVREEGRGEVEGRSRHNVVQRNSENSQSAK